MVSTVLKLVQTILALARLVMAWSRERSFVASGRKEAEADAFRRKQKAEEEADRIDVEISAIHKADSTDGAFLGEYKRDK